MARMASPIECAPVEQAETCDMFGPRRWWRIDSCPGARLTMILPLGFALMDEAMEAAGAVGAVSKACAFDYRDG